MRDYDSLMAILVETLTSSTGAGSDLAVGHYDKADGRLWLMSYEQSLDVAHLAESVLHWLADRDRAVREQALQDFAERIKKNG